MEYGKNLSHAYIIYSPNEDEAFNEAKRLAAAMICESGTGRACMTCKHCSKVMRDIHPDVTVVERLLNDEGKKKRDLAVDQIRQIVADALILPNEAEKKVYIIKEGSYMNTEAQNAFLKILEEPPKFVSFIIIAQNTGSLLETVRSRCASISLAADAGEPSAEMREIAEKFIAVCAKGDSIALLSLCNRCSEMKNAEADEFALAVKALLTDMLCARLPDLKMQRREMMHLIGLMDKMREYLRFNVNAKHIFGMLSVSAGKLK